LRARFIGQTPDVEILCAVTPELWRRDYATETARAVLRWAFEFTDLPRVFAGADTPNAASLRVMQKLGMRFAGNRPTAGDTPYWVIEREEFLAADPAPRDNPD
jgi:RimJ/RimL family protein N-acetyltransferase